MDVRRRLVQVCHELGLSADHVAALIAHESGWRPDAVNAASGASGLIQFMPSTARALGTTVGAIRTMSALAQLELVRRYFAPVSPLAPRDVALAAFLPSAIGRPDDAPLFHRGEAGYDQNAALDADGDGTITAGEVRARIDGVLRRAASKARLPVSGDPPSSSAGGGLFLAGLVLLGVGLLAAGSRG